MPGPKTRVDVQELETPVPFIVLELQFDDSCIPHRGKYLSSRLFDLSFIDGLYERARVAELRRVLPGAARDRPGYRTSVGAEGNIRELRLAAARD